MDHRGLRDFAGDCHAVVRREPDDYPDYESSGERIYYVKGNSNSGWSGIAQAIIVAVFLGLGTVIWYLLSEDNKKDHRITVLEYKCENQPLMRGYDPTRQP
jgi:hypothetical protein